MRGLKEYRRTSVETASGEKLLLLLFEAALLRQDEAIRAMEGEDYLEAVQALIKARNILTELMVSLDHDTAPDLAGNLHRLYAWCITELAQATSSRDIKRVRSVRKVTQTLYEAWTEAVDKMAS